MCSRIFWKAKNLHQSSEQVLRMRWIFHVERAEIPPSSLSDPEETGVQQLHVDYQTSHTSRNGLQKIPSLVRPGAGGALSRRDGNKGRHHAAREGSRQSAAGHSGGSRSWLCHSERERAASQCEGWRESTPTRVRWN
ncbi:hypothetical protein PFLUV_G00149470 [Perca fluviatilis]|uniref:Uncharacterized protein n=1 Tax=Perca fluviatilis TaxID=8168 RepID=A0A6A5E3I3_PERFL|nr:hypothetical protein PFLUV_G00149470 [Perca fluviatilis]